MLSQIWTLSINCLGSSNFESFWLVSYLKKNLFYWSLRDGSVLRALATLVEDLGSVPRIHCVAHNYLWL